MKRNITKILIIVSIYLVAFISLNEVINSGFDNEFPNVVISFPITFLLYYFYFKNKMIDSK